MASLRHPIQTLAHAPTCTCARARTCNLGLGWIGSAVSYEHNTTCTASRRIEVCACIRVRMGGWWAGARGIRVAEDTGVACAEVARESFHEPVDHLRLARQLERRDKLAQCSVERQRLEVELAHIPERRLRSLVAVRQYLSDSRRSTAQ